MSSGKYGLFQNDCSNFGVLGLLKKKKRKIDIFSVYEKFFLTVGRSTRCTIFLSTYISLQKVQYSAVYTYNLNTNTSHIKFVLFQITLTPTLRKTHMKCLYYKETAMMLIFESIRPNAHRAVWLEPAFWNMEKSCLVLYSSLQLAKSQQDHYRQLGRSKPCLRKPCRKWLRKHTSQRLFLSFCS